LPADCWERRHPLAFSLELHRAECEFVTGAVPDAEQRLSALAERCATASEHAVVARLRVDLYMALSQPDRAVSVGLGYLRDGSVLIGRAIRATMRCDGNMSASGLDSGAGPSRNCSTCR
jgi:hypothetical protein